MMKNLNILTERSICAELISGKTITAFTKADKDKIYKTIHKFNLFNRLDINSNFDENNNLIVNFRLLSLEEEKEKDLQLFLRKQKRQEEKTIINKIMAEGELLSYETASKLMEEKTPILIAAYGYTGQNYLLDLKIGDIKTNFQIATQNKSEVFKNFGSQAKYWETFLTHEQVLEEKMKLKILNENLCDTYVTLYAQYSRHFTLSDSDRFVKYMKKDLLKF